MDSDQYATCHEAYPGEDATSRIKSIVQSYELSPRLEERITRIATRQCEAGYMNVFDRQYTYVAHLVDRFTRHRRDRQAVSLDDPTWTRDGRPLYAFLACDTTSDLDARLTYVQSPKQQTLQLLRQRLREPQMAFLSRLLTAVDGRFEVNPYAVAADLGGIRERMNELSARYERDGKIVLPHRQLKEIKFQPLRISFRTRHYRGNPLTFFRKHRGWYEGMSRTELARLDPGLYASLRRAGQLHRAIPHKLPTTPGRKTTRAGHAVMLTSEKE